MTIASSAEKVTTGVETVRSAKRGLLTVEIRSTSRRPATTKKKGAATSEEQIEELLGVEEVKVDVVVDMAKADSEEERKRRRRPQPTSLKLPSEEGKQR